MTEDSEDDDNGLPAGRLTMTRPRLDGNSSIEDLLRAVDDSLRNGASMTRGNLAFEYLCMRLGVDRDTLTDDN